MKTKKTPPPGPGRPADTVLRGRVAEMLRKNWSVNEIAAHFGVTHQAVYALCKRGGIKRRNA